MRLDCCSRAVAHGAAFDYVRIKRPLGKELRVLDALGFILEDVDKDMTDEPPLFLWIGNAGQRLEESVAGIDDVQVGMKMIAESAADGFDFPLAQKTVIHQNARQLGADGSDQQSRGHG